MRPKFILFIAISIAFISCKNTYTLTKIEYASVNIDSTSTPSDSSIHNLILPFSQQLDTKMNEIIGSASMNFTKKKPESTLGNLLADACFEIAKKNSTIKPDFAIINYGGIRVSNLAEGKITLANVYELMPFDNYIVNLEIKAEDLQAVFDLMAQNGGWPISNASYAIKENKAINILIQGKEIQESNTYIIAISDYLANGGDKMFMLKDLKQHTTNILLRDAFIQHFKTNYKNNISLKSAIEKRVVINE